MHLAIEGVGAKHSGAAAVLSGTVAAAIDRGFEHVTVFCAPREFCRFQMPCSSAISWVEQPGAERGRLARIAWLASGLTEAVRRLGADALLCLHGAGIAPAGVPSVTLVQQALPFDADGLSTCGIGTQVRMAAIRLLMLHSCWRAAKVIVQTPTMKSLVTKTFGLPDGRVEVVMPGAPPLPEADRPATELAQLRATPQGRRLLYVGNDSPYKNWRVMITALRLIRDRLPGATLFLTWPSTHAASREAGVACLGYLSRSSLRQAYELADIFVMPSLTETVGLPLLEAMSLGKPVIAADRPYAHDVCGDAAIFFDSFSAEGLANQVVRLLTDTSLSEQLARLGQQRATACGSGEAYGRMLDVVCQAADVNVSGSSAKNAEQ